MVMLDFICMGSAELFGMDRARKIQDIGIQINNKKKFDLQQPLFGILCKLSTFCISLQYTLECQINVEDL